LFIPVDMTVGARVCCMVGVEVGVLEGEEETNVDGAKKESRRNSWYKEVMSCAAYIPEEGEGVYAGDFEGADTNVQSLLVDDLSYPHLTHTLTYCDGRGLQLRR